jgi:hypothetical protein
LIGHWPRTALGSGIVDSNIQPAEPLYRLVDKVANLILLTHVGLHELGLGAKATQFGCERPASLFVSAGYDDLAPALAKA